jgi:hypothetical protein
MVPLMFSLKDTSLLSLLDTIKRLLIERMNTIELLDTPVDIRIERRMTQILMIKTRTIIQ